MMASCGAKAACCHIGYPHRHCEHCDTVIATGYYQLYWNQYIPTALPRPWYTTWGVGTTGTFSQTSQLANQMQALQTNALGSGHNHE